MNRRQTPAAFDLALAFMGATNVDDVRLQRIIARHVAHVLDATDGNLSLTAELLGMHRRSLQRYLRRRGRKRSSR